MARSPNNSAFGVKFVAKDEANILLIVKEGNVTFRCGNMKPNCLDPYAEEVVKRPFRWTVKKSNTTGILKVMVESVDSLTH